MTDDLPNNTCNLELSGKANQYGLPISEIANIYSITDQPIMAFRNIFR